MTKSNEFIKNQSSVLRQLTDQRKTWIQVSTISYAVIIGVIISWAMLTGGHSSLLGISITVTLIGVSLGWWTWTLRIINSLISEQQQQLVILEEVIDNINHIKTHICKNKGD